MNVLPMKRKKPHRRVSATTGIVICRIETIRPNGLNSRDENKTVLAPNSSIALVLQSPVQQIDAPVDHEKLAPTPRHDREPEDHRDERDARSAQSSFAA